QIVPDWRASFQERRQRPGLTLKQLGGRVRLLLLVLRQGSQHLPHGGLAPGCAPKRHRNRSTVVDLPHAGRARKPPYLLHGSRSSLRYRLVVPTWRVIESPDTDCPLPERIPCRYARASKQVTSIISVVPVHTLNVLAPRSVAGHGVAASGFLQPWRTAG